MKTLTESHIHSAIMQFLNSFPNKLIALTFKNTGTMRKGKYCPSNNTRLGVADIIVFPCTSTPFFVEVKKPQTTKSPKGKQSLEQIVFQQKAEELGYTYYIVYSVEDVEKILKSSKII